jgi:hypothetical protein
MFHLVLHYGHLYYKATFSWPKGCSYARAITALPYLVMYPNRLSTLHRNSNIHPEISQLLLEEMILYLIYGLWPFYNYMKFWVTGISNQNQCFILYCIIDTSYCIGSSLHVHVQTEIWFVGNHHCKIVKYWYIVPFQRGHLYYKATFSWPKGCSYARAITALPYLVKVTYLKVNVNGFSYFSSIFSYFNFYPESSLILFHLKSGWYERWPEWSQIVGRI